MGSMKLNLRYAHQNLPQTVEQLYKTAFGPSPSLYRQVSLCGWRPLVDYHLYRPKAWSHRTPAQWAVVPPPSGGIAVHETDAEMTIEVALATVDEESLHLAVAGKMVIIQGALRGDAAADRESDIPRSAPARFQHIIHLPATVNPGGFQASLADGRVVLHFAKRH
ncbi:Hsp20/alpha crystallin family protein [Desulfatitalea alkaliphila]|uniref:Hsp20/alpha crystallin family protein n=1 Tax=Desulfatitalea alkaliphila TaxID=2929485 RepID=A0AA41ULF8_9BACT|nr:Hsp20/alpha crystallin family protein [Desulfatitalea alkaliphila]MCJ8502407.1 Hsp20/alpha crystallin family protein [Desulfatitalea alkaliphila]